jgi:hypothetical protein|tara:strand:+ start:506 stop:691 length:186 start_codon:yes stop_codon:yes gene_type:complete
MWKKFLEIEDKIFSAPYKWLVKKGIVVMLEVSERIYMTMEDLYESRYEEPYRGNPNFPGDD